MTPADHLRARIAALRERIAGHEAALDHLRAELLRAETRSRFELHRGRGLPAPRCCDLPMSFLRDGRWGCHRCGERSAEVAP